MTTIRILPELLSNQIAAGEVVQRPVNAVKELVENAIDAGATSITIEVESGGKSLIRVSDNGIGLSRDDALLAIERYATSKIYQPEDLFSISTMGFRGEALPSIASVSKFTLVTRTADTSVGTCIKMAGGRIQDVSDVGAPEGTLVEVRHLFYNVPARKKFLKAEQTENGHIADAVWGIALGHPHVQFRFFVNGRLQKNFSQTDDLLARSVHILGPDTTGRLYALDRADGQLRVHGYCAHPAITRSTSSRIFLFVNQRLVSDRGLIAAVFKGYRGRIMKGRYPLGVIFIEIGFDQVDVNVHPSKREIKFFNAAPVYQAVTLAIEQALADAQADVSAYAAAKDTLPEQAASPTPAVRPAAFEAADLFMGTDHRVEQAVSEYFVDASLAAAPCESKADANAAPAPAVRIVGQILGTYILAETASGLMLIDQHAAHERIVYENLCRRHAAIGPQIQTLAVPETLELSFAEADFLGGILLELADLGLDIQPFGGTTFVIRGVPAIMDQVDIKPLVVEMIDTAMAAKGQFSKQAWLEACLTLMACHRAIRAGQRLNAVQMQTLVNDLEQCKNSRHCPHGRPIMVFWDKRQIEKQFKRVV